MSYSECWLTTVDNPFDPFSQQEQWYIFDTVKGYNTSGYIARIALTSENMSEQELNEAIEIAVDEIISLDPLHIYRKVYKKQLQDNAS